MQELKKILAVRRDMYKVLGRLYQTEVTAESLAHLKGMRFPEQTENPELNAAGAELNRAISALTVEELDNLAADYARVFLAAGVADERTAFPYESVYTSPERIIKQDAYEKVYLILKKHHIEPAQEDLYADHIGIELEFLSYLSGKAIELMGADDAAAVQENLTEQEDFLAHHIANWTDTFFEDEIAVASSDFYRALGQFARAWVHEDRKWISD